MSATNLDDKALRKAWLKQMFASFEYHDEMLRLHRQWLDVLRRALTRADGDSGPASKGSSFKSIREQSAHFRQRYLPLIEANDDLGKYDKAEWPRYRATATFRSIPDYSRYLISEGDALGWITRAEEAELGKYWGPMAHMASNIRRTVDDTWFSDRKGNDDELLDEESTGPISWPINWREGILGAAGAALAASQGLRAKAGEPVPQSGLWQSVDTAARQQRVNAGDKLPDLGSGYGITIWQRVGD
jgi:hypothetical protein